MLVIKLIAQLYNMVYTKPMVIQTRSSLMYDIYTITSLEISTQYENCLLMFVYKDLTSKLTITQLFCCPQAIGNVARLFTDGFIENPSSCHSVSFKYNLAGNNPGSLRVWIQTTEGDNIRELWFTDQTTTGWTAVDISFRYFSRFRVCKGV